MSDIATKLTYLNGTKQALKESINNIGGDITNETTFREYVQELDNIYDNLPKTTGEGSSLSLNTLKGKMNITPKGDTQQTTYNGYNKINCSMATKTTSGVTATHNADGTYTINGTATANVYFDLCFFELPAGTYKLVGCPSGGSWSSYIQYVRRIDNVQFDMNDTGNGSTITTTGNEGQLRLSIMIYNGYTANNLVFKPMITTNTSLTYNDYEKYVGGTASPNPTFPQNIEVVTGTQEVKVENKNLAIWENGGITTQGIENDQTYTVRTKNYIDTRTQKTFTFSKKMAMTTTTINMMARCYDISKTFIGSQTALSYSATSNTYTFADNVKYIRLVQFGSESENPQLTDYELMCEIGSTKTTYTPHQEQTQVVELSSKNLLDLSQLQIGKAWNGDSNSARAVCFIECDPSTTYTLSLSSISGFDSVFYMEKATKGSTTQLYSTQLTTTTLTKTTTSTSNCIVVQFNKTGVASSDFTNLNIQLEKGDRATTFEEYYNYKLYEEDYIIKTSGKNLASELEQGTINSSGATSSSTTRVRSKYFIDVNSNTSYVVSSISTGIKLYVIEYQENETYIGQTESSWKTLPYTFTTSNNCKKIKLLFATTNGTDTITPSNIANLQLEKGTTATTYEPYGSGKWYACTNWRALSLAIANMNNSENYPGWTSVPYLREDLGLDYNLALSGIVSKFYSNIQTYGLGITINTTYTYSTLFLSRAQYGSDYTQTYWKTNFPSLTFNLVYKLRAPIFTEITNTTLIEQLDNLLEKLKSYNGITNISSSGNLSAILSVSAIKGE